MTDLITYIKSERLRGIKDLDIKNSLEKSGWSSEGVEDAYTHLSQLGKRTKKQSMIYKVLVTIFLLLIFLMIGVYYGYKYIYLSPTRVSAMMIENTQEIETFRYDLNVLLEFVEGSAGGTLEGIPEDSFGEIISSLFLNKYSILASGVVDVSKPRPESRSNVRAFAGILPLFSADVLFTKSDAYFKISDINSIADFIDTNSVSDRWVFVKNKLARNATSNQNVDLEILKKREVFVSEMKSNPPFGVIQRMEDSAIEGTAVYHYKTAFDKVRFVEIYSQVFGTKRDKMINFIEQVQISEIDYYVGKKDLYPYKIEFNVTSLPETTKDTSVNMVISLSLGDFNESVDIYAPEKSVSVEELLNSIIAESDQTLFSGLEKSSIPWKDFGISNF